MDKNSMLSGCTRVGSYYFSAGDSGGAKLELCKPFPRDAAGFTVSTMPEPKLGRSLFLVTNREQRPNLIEQSKLVIVWGE
jgi:hypothetical protein